MENFRASARDWKIVYKTLCHSIFINDISIPYINNIKLLAELNQTITSELVGLEDSINSSLDFNEDRQRSGRPAIKFGLDDQLDARKLRQQDISKDITAAARFAADNLPDFLNECIINYLPEMGHLIAVNEWKPNCDPDELRYLNFQYMFKLGGKLYYRSPLCAELDNRLGDLNTEIIDHENRILKRLSSFIVKYKKDILAPIKIIGLLDCLISIAIISSQNSYIRPIFNFNNVIEIQEARHALIEHTITSYQPNDYYSGGDHYSHVKILTGPNGSGKSMYLRQVALIIFLAHVGSYVPAKMANVALLDCINSRIRATESAAVRLSAFMLDVTQVSQILCNPPAKSLLLFDEFGKGTSEENGLSILAGVLKMFIERVSECPHILLSTHYQQISNYLPQSPFIQYQKMDYIKDIEKGLVFMYKIVDGISMSYGLDMAEMVILDDGIIKRAREIIHCINTNAPIRPLVDNMRYWSQKSDKLNELYLPQPDDNDDSSISEI